MSTETSSSIAKRLILYVILFSSLITLVTTAIQLYSEYDRDISSIDSRFDEIKDIHLNGLATRVWVADKTEIDSQLNGLKNLPFMQYLEVTADDQLISKIGQQETNQIVQKQYPILYQYRGESLNIGSLLVQASLTGVYDHIYEQLWRILLSNAIKTFLVSGFILILFNQLITRHIINISSFTNSLNIDDLQQSLDLDRNSNKKESDELDILVNSITRMQQNLYESVTKRQKAENSVRESREKYRNLLETAHAIPWELDLSNWRFTYVGPQVVDLLGFPQEDWYKEDFWANNLHAADKEQAIEFCTTHTKYNLDHEFEYRMIDSSGNPVWIRDSVNVVSDEDGPKALRGFMFDITNLKNTEFSIKQQEKVAKQHQHTLLYLAKNQNIQNNSILPASRLTNETLCQTLNANMSTIWLFNDNLLGIKCVDRYNSKIDRHTENIEITIHSSTLQSITPENLEDTQILHKTFPEVIDSNEQSNNYVFEAPIKRSENIIGKLIIERSKNLQDWSIEEQSFINSAADIISFTLEFWKHAETTKQLAQYQKQLESLVEKRTRQVHEQAIIIDQIHDAVISLDLNNIITSWNYGAERLFGYQTNEVIGQPINLIFPTNKHPFFDDMLVEKLIDMESIEMEIELSNNQKQNFHALLSLSLLHDPQDKPKGFVCFALDISDRKKAEQSLLQQTTELRTVNNELEAFCYSVSHDLRTPLRSISGFSHAIREDYGKLLDDKGVDYLTRVENAAQHMSDLITDMLNLSRVTRTELKYEAINVNSLIQELVSLSDFPKDIITIQENLNINGDKALLKIAMSNILSNAVKYSQYRENPKIEIGKIYIGKESIFYVKDNGVGFDQNYAKNLFMPFHRLHAKEDFEGSGIGLATVQRIIEKHHGRIWAEAEEDKGATFYFTIGDYA